MEKINMSNNSKDVIRTLVGLKSRISPIHSRFTLVALSLCTLLLLGGFTSSVWGGTTETTKTNVEGVWYSLYSDTEYTSGHTYTVVPPTDGNVIFEWRKSQSGIWGSYNGFQLDVSYSNDGSSYSDKTRVVASTVYEKYASYKEETKAISGSQNAVKVKFEYGTCTRTNYYQNVRVKMAAHILLDNSDAVGVTSKSGTLANTVYGNTSAAYHIDLRSFLMEGTRINYVIENDDDDTEFHFGSNATTKYYDVLANSCAFAGGTADCASTATSLGDPDDYEADVYFTPAANKNGSSSATLYIKDGSTTRVTINLTAKVIPTYYFKATSVATDGTSTLDIPVKASFTSGVYSGSTLTISQTAATADVASLTKRAYFYAPASSGDYQFQGWYTNAACTSDRVSTDNTIYYDITSSGLTSGTAVEKKYYAKYLESITAEFENEGSHDLEVGDTYESISYSRTSSATATDDDEDEENFFWYEIVDNTPAGITTGSDNADKIISYNPSTKVVTAHNAGTATLRLHQRAHSLYEAVDAEYEFTVSKKTNALKCAWNNGSAGDDWDENVNFDSKLPVKFSSSNTSGPAISVTPSPASAVATFKNGAGGANPDTIITNHREGTVTWTVIQAEDYKYVADTMTCSVIVGTVPSPGCTIKLYDGDNTERKCSEFGDNRAVWSPAGKAVKLYFEAERTTLLSKSITPYEYVNGEWVTHDGWAVGGSLDRNSFKTFDRDLSANATAVKFSASDNDDIRVRKVYVTGVSYFNIDTIGGGAITKLNMPVNTKGGNVTRAKFCVDYGTCADNIKLASDHPRIKFAASSSTTHSFSTGANHHGRDTIELTYTSPADEGEDITATITIYTPFDHKTLTVKAISKGKLSTTLEYKGADSYPVNQANMNATELFQVRDENGDLVASPAITLSSNNTSAINTVSSNTAIDFLCGADDVRITASYAGDATYAAASNSGTFYHDIDVTKLADAITWTIGSDAENKIHVWADSDVPNTIASSDYTSIATYSSNNSDRLSISGSAGSYSLHAGQKGEVTLTATSAGDCTYNVAEESKTIVVDPCRHDIVWNQSFKSLMTEEDGTIDQTIDLTAYAVDSNGVATNKSITYTLASTAFASIVDGTKLHITGAGETTITASTADDNKYDRASASLQVRVRRYGEGCNSEVADPNQHNVSYYTNRSGKEYPIPPSDTIYVKIGRKSNITCAYISIFGYDEDSVETELAKMHPDTLLNDGKNYIIPIDEKYRKIKFQATGRTGIDPVPGDGGTQYKWFSNLRITQKSYLRSSRANITNDRVHVYDAINETVVVSYSDKPLLNYRITGSHLTLTPSETVDNDCGDFGSYTFTVRGSYTTSGHFRDTIYITTTALDTLRIPIDFKVSPGTELYFQSSSGSWNTETKWTNETGVVQDQVPAHDNRVVISEAVTIDCQAEAYKVTIGEGGSVTIVPGGGLSVGAGGIDGATPENLILKAGTEGATKGQTGYLRIAPEYAATMPQATVEFYSTVHYNTALSGDSAATYQCVGAPVEGVLAKTVFTPGSYLYTWDEGQDGWVSSRTKLTFEAFKGFEVTQKKAAAGLGFEYAGQLISVSGVKTINLDFSDPKKGYNLLANSFTAPIDIAQFRAGDIINAEKTIYILNAGTKANSDNPEEDIDAPGKWIGMPIATVEDLAKEFGYPRMIAPMQGFWIKATGASPQLKLDYSRLVWGVDYSEDRANKPLRAPKRNAELDEEMPITGKLQVSLYSETERDFFFMLESERYDAAYENGYDAPKIPSGSMDVFTVEGENELGVDATNSIIGTRVGVRTGGESVYTFVFSHLSGEHEWALYDHETGDKTDINEGTEYMFFAEPYSLLNGRFEIVERADAPSVTTGIDGADNEVKAYKFIKDNQLYILKNGVLYNVMGGVVR